MTAVGNVDGREVDKRDAYSGSVHSHATWRTSGVQVETETRTSEGKPSRFTWRL